MSDVASSVVRRNRLIEQRPLHMCMALIRIANVQKSSCGESLKNWSDFVENIKVGDTIYCRTKFGVAPVVISRIEVIDSCPVDIPVKKVANQIIKHCEVTR